MAITPQQNMVAERRNRSIIERARCMANANNCLGFLCPEVVNTANHLLNLSPTRANSSILPDQLYYKAIPRVEHLRIFGSLCYLHVLKEQRSKLDSKTKPCFFVGYDEQSKACRVYKPISHIIHISRDIVFKARKVGFQYCQQTFIAFPKENSELSDQADSQPLDSSPTNNPQLLETIQSPPSPHSVYTPPHSPTSLLTPDISSQTSLSPNPNINEETPLQLVPTLLIVLQRNPLRERRPNSKFKDHFNFSITNTSKDIDFPIERKISSRLCLTLARKPPFKRRSTLY
jgi:hypothetical protein